MIEQLESRDEDNQEAMDKMKEEYQADMNRMQAVADDLRQQLHQAREEIEQLMAA